MTRPALGESGLAVAEIVGGKLFGPGKRPVTTVTIDSRTCGAGSLFVALPGEHTDGHLFVADALRSGASMALVRSDWASGRETEISALLGETDAGVCAVDDPLSALQDLARARLASFPHLRRVGITGSNGKTTTKELIASVLSQKDSTFKTRGNYNSEIGVPLSVFDVGEEHVFGVFELAMNHVGEMEVLADIVRPDLAVITNIGTAHIGLVGSQEAIAYEKRRVFSRFDGSQTAVLYESEPYRAVLEDGAAAHIVTFGPETTLGYEGFEPRGVEGTVLRWRGRRIRLPLAGEHNVRNALAAITVGLQLGCSDDDIQAGLESAQPEFGRGEVIRGTITVLHDSYNANVDSMRAAIELIAETPHRSGKKILVLGAMYELGSYTAAHHEAVAASALASGADVTVLFGEEFEAAAKALSDQDAEASKRLMWAGDIDELSSLISETVREGDLVLLKGSRGTRLERLLPLLTRGGGGS
ncbi:MAG: UDP-N-acetylmuramoyl-tripeptide--D-alanyl-D-alanine ligase [Spirochaetota bacterium]